MTKRPAAKGMGDDCLSEQAGTVPSDGAVRRVVYRFEVNVQTSAQVMIQKGVYDVSDSMHFFKTAATALFLSAGWRHPFQCGRQGFSASSQGINFWREEVEDKGLGFGGHIQVCAKRVRGLGFRRDPNSFKKSEPFQLKSARGCFSLGPCSGPKAHVFLLGQVFSNNSELELLSRRAILKSNDCVGVCEFVYTNTYLPTCVRTNVRLRVYVCACGHEACICVFRCF